MEIGMLHEVLENMEDGAYNFCNGNDCSGCGECCSAFLPVSDNELREIKRYVKKKHIKPVVHVAPMVVGFDMVCPFCDTSKEKDKCLIYSVKPKICRAFKCNQPPSKVKENKELFWRTRKPINMWEVIRCF